MELLATQREFSAYGPSHCVVLAVFAIGAALLVWIGRRQSESQARLLGRVLAVLILAAFTVALVYKLIRPTIDGSVPLQLCDVAELTAAYALDELAAPRPASTVLVHSAAGGVGGALLQLARLRGIHAVGVVGSSPIRWR